MDQIWETWMPSKKNRTLTYHVTRKKTQVVSETMMGNMIKYFRMIHGLQSLGMDWSLGRVGVSPAVED